MKKEEKQGFIQKAIGLGAQKGIETIEEKARAANQRTGLELTITRIAKKLLNLEKNE